jgi:uncharacterized protein YkwD
MLRRVQSFAALAVLAACAATQQPAPPSAPAAPPPAPKPGGPASVNINALEQQVIRATNAFRDEHKLLPLKPSVQLIVVAQMHARNMARQDKFGDSDKNGHILDGKNFEERIRVSGYPFARAAENVGYQHNKPDPAAAMMTDWKNSPGHRRNMLIPEIVEIGVGAAQGQSGRWYFVQVFGVQQPRGKQASLEPGQVRSGRAAGA